MNKQDKIDWIRSQIYDLIYQMYIVRPADITPIPDDLLKRYNYYMDADNVDILKLNAFYDEIKRIERLLK